MISSTHILRSLLSTVVTMSLASTVSAQTRGWVNLVLPETGGTAVRLITPNVDLSKRQPLIVFLHGAGGAPHHYQTFLIAAARALGVPLIMPKSSSNLGWGFGNDAQRVLESIALMQETVEIDPERISISGHSAGGGFAILLGLAQGSIFNAIFQLSSPFVAVGSTPPSYKPALRQYYGEDDPNFAQARSLLRQQWIDLGLTFEEQIEPGFGHSDWPSGTFEAGFEFLLRHTRPKETLPGYQPEPPPESSCRDQTTLCLLDERFTASVHFIVGDQEQAARVVPGQSSDSGLFWFFQPQNWELLVKVIDGCALNDRIWVFSAATTDVEFTLSVINRETGEERTYHNPAGQPAPAITDTSAFAACGTP